MKADGESGKEVVKGRKASCGPKVAKVTSARTNFAFLFTILVHLRESMAVKQRILH